MAQSAGWEFFYQHSWEWSFSYHPAGSAEHIFFSQQQKKIENHALTVLNYHPYGFYVVFCENVLLGAPEVLLVVKRSPLMVFSS